MLLAALLIIAQQQVPSLTVPPQTEQTIVFSDRGRTYFVGVTTGTVKYLEDRNPPPDDNPDNNGLTGRSLEFYKLIKSKVVDPSQRSAGASGLISSIDATVAQAGAISLELSKMVDLLADYATQNQVNQYWTGVRFGDFLSSKEPKTTADLVAILADVRKACVELQK
jgi:hypothetical protein